MSLPAPTEPSACGICGDLLRDTDGQAIPTTSGGAVHIRCAEEQARAAARQRAARAALSAVVGVGVWGLVMEAGALRVAGEALLVVLLAVLLIGMHVLINRRWWQYTIQSARLWWRMWR